MTEPKKVLVVDDDPPINELVKLVLEARGYRVISSVDGESALRSLEEVRPDLVLLDVLIPDMNGLEICRRIKGDERFRRIKVVMLSARSLDTDRAKAREFGADAYLGKPIRMADLLDTVNELLS